MNPEDVQEQSTPSVTQPQPVSSPQIQNTQDPIIPPNNPPKKSTPTVIISVLAVIFIFIAFMIIAVILINRIRTVQNAPNGEIPENLTPTIRISPTTMPTMPIQTITNKPTVSLTPTSIPSPTFSPTSKPLPTSTNTPSPTPTRTPNPPGITISFPQEGQTVSQSSPQICVVDIASGGDTSGINRRQNINNQGWTGYASMTTLCFNAQTGANSIMLQYKNSYNEESPIYTRNFTYQP